MWTVLPAVDYPEGTGCRYTPEREQAKYLSGQVSAPQTPPFSLLWKSLTDKIQDKRHKNMMDAGDEFMV